MGILLPTVVGLSASIFGTLVNFDAGNLGWVTVFSTMAVVNASILVASLRND